MAGQRRRRLVASMRSEGDLPLTGPFEPCAFEEAAVEEALTRIEGATDVAVCRRPHVTPVAEALACAMARQLGLPVPDDDDGD